MYRAISRVVQRAVAGWRACPRGRSGVVQFTRPPENPVPPSQRIGGPLYTAQEDVRMLLEICVERLGGRVEITDDQLREATTLHYGRARRVWWHDDHHLELQALPPSQRRPAA